jgi:hypothetical protein
VDTSDRDALQIDADRLGQSEDDQPCMACGSAGPCGPSFRTHGHRPRSWSGRAVQEGLAFLLYEKGWHFKTHQDTEKASGMFGTLVVQFPSQYRGGAIAARHAGVDREFDMGENDSSSLHEFYHVAFYADCKHGIREVTDGSRLVAVYSLCWNQTGTPPPPPSIETALLLK